ncbi:MAG: hypothetical protein P1V20_17070 [Verrucomicrobiales bacterium]|nr:hypothetical protein [Verrucomicrobiales bacterium]
MKLQFSILTTILFLALSNLPVQAQENAPFSRSVLNYISSEDSRNIYYAIFYLSEKAEELSYDSKQKVEKLTRFFQYENAFRTSQSGDEEKDQYFQRYQDRKTLLEDLTKSSRSFNDERGKIAATHLLDLVVTIDPHFVEAAYEREKLFINDNTRLAWNGLSKAKGTSSRLPGGMVAASGGVFEVDFSIMSGVATGSAVGGLAKSQSLIKGLLVQELSGSQFAGEASQMNATVLGKSSGSSMSVKFNQKVGEMMTDAVGKMMSFLKSRHGTLPEGVQVELSFEEQYIPKDGPSAGVACTLMLDALLKGHEYSPGFAVTGALDEKGAVGGVGGVDGKIRGAISRNCEMVAIPSENERVIQDLLILEGPANLAKIQIVEIETYDDALQVAKKHDTRDEEVKKAIETFREVQAVLNRPGGLAYINNRQVQSKLRSVLQVLPNHLSAKYLLLKGMGRDPGNLTLLGSVQAIDRNAAPLINALREGDFDIQDRLRKDSFAETMSALTRLRPLLDERTRPCADAIVTYSGYVRVAINNPPRSPSARNQLINNLRSSGRDVGTQYDQLFKRPDVKAELMIDDEDE